jgi:hypothetical protein
MTLPANIWLNDITEHFADLRQGIAAKKQNPPLADFVGWRFPLAPLMFKLA